MKKLMNKDSKVIWMLKALLGAYIITGIMLLLLTLLLYKLDLNEQKVTVGIIMIYVISTFTGGIVIGKCVKTRRFIWGLMLGIIYFALLMLVSLGVYRSFQGNGTNIGTSFLLCAGGGMLGGMISWQKVGRRG
ncbi:MAG: TIGR04086 family membrane protein [Lachnospiraceae bacterium]